MFHQSQSEERPTRKVWKCAQPGCYRVALPPTGDGPRFTLDELLTAG
jgi:hypothetical protein